MTKYSVVEFNRVVAQKTGNMKSQFPLDPTAFADKVAENGMLLVVDEIAGTVKFPTDVTAPVVYIHFSPEKLYNNEGLNAFALAPGGLYPNMYALAVGDTFTTNCVSGDMTTAVGGTNYGVPDASGKIKLVVVAGIATANVVLDVVKKTTLPNGDLALKFVVKRISL